MKLLKATYLLFLTALLASCAVTSPKRLAAYYAGDIDSTITDGYRPSGILTEEYYPTSVPGPSQRRMIVYLPEDYNTGNRHYPVVYMLHGARGYETSWIRKGNILQIVDSLSLNGLVEPAIIVMPNVNQYNNDADMDKSRRKGALESLFEIDGTVESAFINDVVRFVDSKYRTIPDKDHRAIGGLSIGGLQSLYISANNPDIFGYMGLFSPMYKIMQKHSEFNGFYKSLKEKLTAQFAEKPQMYLIMIGKADFFLPHIKNYHKYLTRMEYSHTFIITPGGHDWPYWKQDFIYMMEHTFK